MENFEKKFEKKQLTEHTGIPGPELELPVHIPHTPEIEREKKITPEQLDDLIKHPEKQWDQDDERNNPAKKPTLN